MTTAAERAKQFAKYCELHPQLRFWQALVSFAGVGFIGISDDKETWLDTFYLADIYPQKADSGEWK